MVVIHEQRDLKVNFYDATWEGVWDTMSMQKGEVVVTHDKVV